MRYPLHVQTCTSHYIPALLVYKVETIVVNSEREENANSHLLNECTYLLFTHAQRVGYEQLHVINNQHQLWSCSHGTCGTSSWFNEEYTLATKLMPQWLMFRGVNCVTITRMDVATCVDDKIWSAILGEQ